MKKEKKETKPVSVKSLKKIMNNLPMKATDARVLVFLKGREYVIKEVGQFRVIPNLTFHIELNKDGQLSN